VRVRQDDAPGNTGRPLLTPGSSEQLTRRPRAAGIRAPVGHPWRTAGDRSLGGDRTRRIPDGARQLARDRRASGRVLLRDRNNPFCLTSTPTCIVPASNSQARARLAIGSCTGPTFNRRRSGTSRILRLFSCLIRRVRLDDNVRGDPEDSRAVIAEPAFWLFSYPFWQTRTNTQSIPCFARRADLRVASGVFFWRPHFTPRPPPVHESSRATVSTCNIDFVTIGSGSLRRRRPILFAASQCRLN